MITHSLFHSLTHSVTLSLLTIKHIDDFVECCDAFGGHLNDLAISSRSALLLQNL